MYYARHPYARIGQAVGPFAPRSPLGVAGPFLPGTPPIALPSTRLETRDDVWRELLTALVQQAPAEQSLTLIQRFRNATTRDPFFRTGSDATHPLFTMKRALVQYLPLWGGPPPPGYASGPRIVGVFEPVVPAANEALLKWLDRATSGFYAVGPENQTPYVIVGSVEALTPPPPAA